MNTPRVRSVCRCLSLLSLGAILLAASAAHADEDVASTEAASTTPTEAVIDAFVPWEGRGFTYPTGPDQGTFVGTFNGIVYVQTEKGPTSGGLMICPAMMDFSLTTGKQTGSGKCSIAGEEGHRMFAEWSCEGVRLIGCKGTFTITGGTGRFEGASGGGPMMARTSLYLGSAEEPGTVAAESAQGLMVLDQLKVVLPGKN
jgi:hypothetical protein